MESFEDPHERIKEHSRGLPKVANHIGPLPPEHPCAFDDLQKWALLALFRNVIPVAFQVSSYVDEDDACDACTFTEPFPRNFDSKCCCCEPAEYDDIEGTYEGNGNCESGTPKMYYMIYFLA